MDQIDTDNDSDDPEDTVDDRNNSDEEAEHSHSDGAKGGCQRVLGVTVNNLGVETVSLVLCHYITRLFKHCLSRFLSIVCGVVIMF